jgi:hypothetical protein
LRFVVHKIVIPTQAGAHAQRLQLRRDEVGCCPTMMWAGGEKVAQFLQEWHVMILTKLPEIEVRFVEPPMSVLIEVSDGDGPEEKILSRKTSSACATRTHMHSCSARL